MDSDEDELAVYDTTTTPYRVQRFVDGTTAKANGRVIAEAGPSTKPSIKTRAKVRNRSPSPQDDVEDIADVEARDGDGEGLNYALAPAATTRKGRSKRGASREPEHVKPPKAASIPKGKGKGKGRANNTHETSPKGMDVDALEELQEDEPVEIARPPAQAWRLKKNQQDRESAAWRKREERHKREMERLQRQCEDAMNQRDSLARQLEELFLTRSTEAETNAEQQAMIYESRLQTQEEMIQELTSQLARVDSLTREGKTSTLHFLTREAADEERRGVERQLEVLKLALKEKDSVIAEKDATIQQQSAEVRELQRELNAEIERSKSLASARPNGRESLSRPRSGAKLDGVKALNTYKLYEDLTNILILDCKCDISADTNEEQWVFTCVYSHSGTEWSLSFSLRSYNESGEEGESVEKVAYTPKEMSNKSPDFLGKLNILAGEFTFHRSQLDVFLDKLYTVMSDASGTD